MYLNADVNVFAFHAPWLAGCRSREEAKGYIYGSWMWKPPCGNEVDVGRDISIQATNSVDSRKLPWRWTSGRCAGRGGREGSAFLRHVILTDD